MIFSLVVTVMISSPEVQERISCWVEQGMMYFRATVLTLLWTVTGMCQSPIHYPMTLVDCRFH